MTAKPITPGQKKQLSRFVRDAAEHVSLDDFDAEAAQRIIESGDKLPEAFKLALLRLSRKPDAVRITQAQRLWEVGLGRDLGLKHNEFEGYLEMMPEVPDSLLAPDPFLPLLRLLDPRLGAQKICQLAKVADYGVSNLDPFDQRHATPMVPHWVRALDGRVNHGRTPNDCRAECVGKLLAGTDHVGLALYIHDNNVVKKGEHVMDLPGSVHRDARSYCAFLEVWDVGPGLDDHRHSGIPYLQYGTVVFSRE